MMRMSRIAVVAWSVVLCALGASGQTADSVGRVLDAARLAYEQQMEGVRTDVVRQLERKMKTPNEAAQAREELARFNEKGTWPELPAAQALRDRAAGAAQRMRQGYDSAANSYKKIKEPGLAALISAEAQAFERESDVAPWRAASTTAGAEPVQVGQAGLSIDLDVSSPLRVEVRGKTTGDVEVHVPSMQKKLTKFTLRAGTDGSFRALFSVREGGVSLDAGAARTSTGADVLPDGGSAMVVRCAGGKATLESVRWKPIVSGAPERLAQREPSTPARSTPPAGRPEKLDLSGEWDGELWQSGRADRPHVEATFERVTDTNVTIKIRYGNGSVARLHFERDGSVIKLREAVYPRNQREVSNPGKGQVGPDKVSWSGEWIVKTGNAENEQTMTLSLKKKP